MMEPFQHQIDGARAQGIPNALLYFVLENKAGTSMHITRVMEDELDKMPQCRFEFMFGSIPKFKEYGAAN